MNLMVGLQGGAHGRVLKVPNELNYIGIQYGQV